MRLVLSSWCIGLAIAAIGCDGGSTNGAPSGTCPANQSLCNGVCVATGSCQTPGTGGAGGAIVGSNGGAIVNSNGGATVVGNGGATVVGSGGQTVTATGGQPPGTGGTTVVASGGRTGTGGATVVGNGGATVVASGGAYVDNPTVCNDTSTVSSSMSGQYSRLYISTNTPGKNYVAITNWWHVFNSQTVDVSGIGFKVTNTASTSDNSPVGFPTIFIGTYQNNASAGSNLPKQLSAITSAPTVFDTNATSLDTSNFNATYDIWLTANSTPLSSATASSPGAGGAYVMVWLYKPSNRQPRGSVKASGQTIGKVSNNWDVWVDSTNPPCISYVAKTPISSLSFDIKDFLTDSTKYGVTTSMYLSIVFAGFEIWNGGNGAQIKNFCAKVN